jgi:hypothetical protein
MFSPISDDVGEITALVDELIHIRQLSVMLPTLKLPKAF